ncbi:hypothetical protein ACJX0J_035926 [Zea mays]
MPYIRLEMEKDEILGRQLLIATIVELWNGILDELKITLVEIQITQFFLCKKLSSLQEILLKKNKKKQNAVLGLDVVALDFGLGVCDSWQSTSLYAHYLMLVLLQFTKHNKT